jgi:hypothetical protein
MRGSTPEVSSGARACKQPRDTELMAWCEYTSPGSGGRLHGLRWMCFAHPRGEVQSLGGGRYRGGGGSQCFQPMCRSILSITVGSVMKEIICILPPHREQSRGSSFQTFLINLLRAKVRKIEKWLENGEDKKGPRGNVKQSNLTDGESAKMPSAHGVVQGYNGIAAVDSKHQVVVHAEAFGEGQEKQLLRPMLEGIRENFAELGERADVLGGTVVVADNGYHSEENVRMLLEEGIDAYLPDNHFRKGDPAFATAQQYRRPVDRKKTRYRSRPRKSSTSASNAFCRINCAPRLAASPSGSPLSRSPVNSSCSIRSLGAILFFIGVTSFCEDEIHPRFLFRVFGGYTLFTFTGRLGHHP